ncbi:DUF2157 domain-containing protein [Pontiellaceae bacterium B12219]|nr:DUF2157 domain-containing protein [Pontiellaceae bacterium B12219]
MRRVSGKQVQWLKRELPILENEGILSSEKSREISTYYTEQTASGIHWAVLVFSVLGSLLIGSGIILLFAHNWEELSQSTRAVLSFCPLLIGAGLSAFALLKNRGTAFRESAGIFHSLAVGASIALIGQTYHIPGNMPGFMLTWALLILPLTVLFSATGPLLIYLALICGWCGAAQQNYGQATAFWLLLLPALGKVSAMVRVRRNDPDTLVSLFGFLSCLTISLGIVFERTVPGLWIIAYSALLAAAALFGILFYEDEDGFSNPLKTFGIIGIAILTYLFTWSDMWREIGWNYIRFGWHHKPWGVGFDTAITFALLLVWILAAVKAFRRHSLETLTLAVFPIIGTLGFVLSSGYGKTGYLISSLIFNAFMFYLGLMYIVLGCRNTRLRQLNGGMAVLSLLLVTRFFDQDFGFLARGLVFISLGTCFLVVNLIMSNRKKRLGIR